MPRFLLITLTVRRRTIASCAVRCAPLIHTRVVLVRHCSFTPTRRSLGCWRARWPFSWWPLGGGALREGPLSCGARCGRFLRGWTNSSSCLWCWSPCGRDPNICTVHKGFLFLSQSNSAVSVLVTAPVVSYRPPPLYNAVITRKAFGKDELDVVISVSGGMQLPRVGPIRLQQDMNQLVLCDWTSHELAYAESKESLMI